jgi:DNA repair protein RadC
MGYESPMEMSQEDLAIQAYLVKKGMEEYEAGSLKLVEDADKLIQEGLENPPSDLKKTTNDAVNELITKKNRYNKIPKSRKPMGANLLNQIKDDAERLGFTVVNVKGGNISLTSKENGKVVARRDVDRKFNKERNDKLKEAKSMAQDSLLGLRASILLYFMRGGKVMTSQSELAGKDEIAAAKRAGFISDNGRSVDLIALEDLPELGGIVFDEQDAINEVLDVLASFENKSQMEDELIEMRDKLTNDMDEAARYEYESQMRDAIRNNDLGSLSEDELVEYYESLSEDEKVKTIEDYEKFYQEIERQQPEQGRQGGYGISPSEGTTQEAQEQKVGYEGQNVKEAVGYRGLPGEYVQDYNGVQYFAENEKYAGVFGKNIIKANISKNKVLDLAKWNKKLKDAGIPDNGMGQPFLTIDQSMFDGDRNFTTKGREGTFGKMKRAIGLDEFNKFKEEFDSSDVIYGEDAGNAGEMVYAVRNPRAIKVQEQAEGLVGNKKITDGPNEGLTRTDTAAGPIVSESGNIPYSERGGVRGQGVRDGGTGNTVKAVWNEYKQIQFNGSVKVKDAEDVAHIMRKLEDKAVEHAFAVHVDKNGDAHIQFLGMGGPTSTIVDPRLILAGAKKFKSKKVYIVHNHPSGSLVASSPDMNLTRAVDRVLSPLNIKLEHVIMDTYKKQYVHLYPDDTSLVKNRDITKESIEEYNKALKVEIMDEQKILSQPFDAIRDSRGVAEFLMQVRFTALPKDGMLLLNNKNEIIGNYIFKKGFNYRETTSFIAEAATGTGVIFYSNRGQSGFYSGVNPMIRALGSAEIKVLDYVVVNSDSEGVKGYYESYADQGKLNETQAEYGTNSIPNELREPTPRTNAEIQSLMENAADAVEQAIQSGTSPQVAVNNIVGNQDWYNGLTSKLKEQFDEILQDEFGATPKLQPKAQPKAKTPKAEKPSGVKSSISELVDNYYKLKDKTPGARDAIDEILGRDPKLKYIYDNIPKINKRLQEAGVITNKTDGCP